MRFDSMAAILLRDVYLSILSILILQVDTSETFSMMPIEQDNSTHYVRGVFSSDLPDPLFYSTYIPLIYEIDVPKWELSDLNIQWPKGFHSDCEMSDTFIENWARFACPEIHYMLDVSERILASVSDWKQINSTNKPKKLEQFSCYEITPHFTSYSLGEEDREEYLHQSLQNCPLGHVMYDHFVPFHTDVNVTTFATMLSRFIEEYASKKRYRLVGYSKYASVTNAYSSLQTTQYLDYIYTSTKWTNGITTCESGRIPYSLVSTSMLKESLSEVDKTLRTKEQSKYKLTIDANDFSLYYKLPLADCIFTTKGTYLVRVLVPIIGSELEYKMIIMSPIPFLRNFGSLTEICGFDHPPAPILVEKTSGFVAPTECEPGQLCHVPDVASRPSLNYCLHALVNNSTQDIIYYCDLQCRYLGKSHLPQFRRIDTDKYTIVGRPKMDIFVKCDTQLVKAIYPPDTVGALEVTLPCNCQIVHGKIVLHSIPPCSFTLKLRYIAPVSWEEIPFQTENETMPVHSSADSTTAAAQPLMTLMESGAQSALQRYSDMKALKIKIYVLLIVILILFCLTGVLMISITKLNSRVGSLEKLRNQSNFNDAPLPMYVRSVNE